MRLKRDLTTREPAFAQCPIPVLCSPVSDKALRLYLILWWDAFSNRKYDDKGYPYAVMSYDEMAKILRCNRKKAIQCINELILAKFVKKKNTRTSNRYYFAQR